MEVLKRWLDRRNERHIVKKEAARLCEGNPRHRVRDLETVEGNE